MTKKKSIDPKEKFLSLAVGNTADEFFLENYTETKYTVVGYDFLKEIYNQPAHSLATDSYFQFVFGTFYAMSRLFVSAEFIRKFYIKMDEVKQMEKTDDLDAVQIAVDLSTGEKGLQFSFVTKMLNLENDTLYPIYDSKVALICGFKGLMQDRDRKAEQYREWYQCIIRIYNELLQDQQALIVLNKFRQIFHCPTLSDMRVLDIIFWQLGKSDEKQKAKLKNR